MSAFDELDSLVQHHIVNTLGWRELRYLQEESIEPIQRGEHCLLIAPTAGGKTEAAFFPVLSSIIRSERSGVSVLYVCPLRALLNNLYSRLGEYCGMVGRSCGLWHGDTTQGERKKILLERPDVLLTTPESLEVMLVSARDDGRELLKDVHTVIIDEIHAFAGDDRGWHLLTVLERIRCIAQREIQRIGLSATVGNPDELLSWLAGHCDGKRKVINPCSPQLDPKADVKLDYVGSLQNAAIVISRLNRGEKRLVFCDSRAKVEQLGNELRRLEVSVFLSHSSLSIEERRSAENAFSEGQDCVIVSTSTMELGIDIGNLDRVIQIDAPYTVASFLQRIGRTGRRAESVRNCLFLATNQDALLRASALVSLWETGYIEPISPPEKPLHLFAQQIMALALQEKGIGIHDWAKWINRLPAFASISTADKDRIFQFLLSERILFSDGVRYSFDDEGIAKYGRRHFIDLVSVFTSPPLFMVLHGRRELGTVDQIALIHHRPEKPAVLSLGGRSWEISEVEWKDRKIYVIPSHDRGSSRWLGTRSGTSFNLCQRIKDVIVNQKESELWTTRACSQISDLRGDFDFLHEEDSTLLIRPESQEIIWYTFAGLIYNLALADSLRSIGINILTIREYWIRLEGSLDHTEVSKVVKTLTPSKVISNFEIPPDFEDHLKFSECLPKDLSDSIIRDRLLNVNILESILSKDIRTVIIK